MALAAFRCPSTLEVQPRSQVAVLNIKIKKLPEHLHGKQSRRAPSPGGGRRAETSDCAETAPRSGSTTGENAGAIPPPGRCRARGRRPPRVAAEAFRRSRSFTRFEPFSARGLRPLDPRGKEVKTHGVSVRATRNPIVEVATAGGVPVAEGRTEAPRIVAPGTAAQDATLAAPAAGPRCPITRRPRVVLMPTVFHLYRTRFLGHTLALRGMA